MPDVDIEQITPQLTWKLRHRELYPKVGTIYDMGMPEDESGTHFGAFYNNDLAGVVSLFNECTDFQFRKFAVAKAAQSQGIGAALLKYITGYAIENGASRLWCNARSTAVGFYAKAGFTIVGKPFSRNDIEYVIMEKHFQ